MALVMRLRRQGARKKPFYRIVVADSRAPRDGRFVALIGTYDPAGENRINIKGDAAEHWLNVGARPTLTVAKLLKKARESTAAAS